MYFYTLYWGRGLKYVSYTFCIGGGASKMYSNTFFLLSVNRVSVNRVSVNRGVSESCVSESWCQ